MRNKLLASFLSLTLLLSFGAIFAHAQGTGTGSDGGTNTGRDGGTGTGRDGGTGTGRDGGTGTIDIGIKLTNPLRTDNSLTDLLKNIVNNILIPIGGIIAVLAFIWSGFKYVTARGDTKAISEAHRSLLYTAIGTAILLGAWVLIEVIGATINQLKS